MLASKNRQTFINLDDQRLFYRPFDEIFPPKLAPNFVGSSENVQLSKSSLKNDLKLRRLVIPLKHFYFTKSWFQDVVKTLNPSLT